MATDLARARDDAALEDFLLAALQRWPQNRAFLKLLLGLGKGRPPSAQLLSRYASMPRSAAVEARFSALLMASGDDGRAWDAAARGVRSFSQPMTRADARASLSRLFSWYGRLDLGEKLLALDRDDDPLALAYDTAMLRAVEGYDPQTGEIFQSLLRSDNSFRAKAAIAFLDYRWKFCGASARLLEDSAIWLGQQDNTLFHALRASLALEIGQRDAASAILRHQPALLDFELLSLADLASQESLPCLTPELRHQADLYRRIVDATAAMESCIRANTASLAVVGNSSCEAGLGKGAAIDAKQLVVRFNRAGQVSGFEEDYGKRTDIHVLPTGAGGAEGMPAPDARFVLFTVGSALFRNRKWKHARQILAQGKSLAVIPGDGFAWLATRLGAPPSNGMRVCHHLTRLLGRKLDAAEVFGFSLIDQIGPDAKSAHYFEAARPSLHHDWRAERRLFDEEILATSN